MCGLIGIISSERAWSKKSKLGAADEQQKQKFFRQGLIIDTLRGDDSTGVFYVPEQNEKGLTAGWLKALGDGYSFVNSKDYEELIKANMGHAKYMIGHNRAATQGKVNVDNAHPFQEGNVTLVHNGTLYTTDNLPMSQTSLGISVDSHAICHNIAAAPATPEGVRGVIEKLDGAFALIWHDARNDSLNIIRNSERGLYRAKAKYYNTTYFSSEREMLLLLLTRNNIAYESIEKVEAGTYYQYQGNRLVHTSKFELEDYSTPSRVYGSYYGSAWGSYGGNKPTVITPTPTPVPEPQPASNYLLPPPPPGTTHQDALAGAEFTVRDKVQFVYDKRDVKVMDKRCIVKGRIGGTNYSATMQGNLLIEPLLRGQPVCVTPIGVNQIGQDTVILTRFYAGSWSEDMYYRELLELVEEEDKEFLEVEDDFGDEILFPGYDKHLTFAQWTVATRDGCCCCGAQADILDAGTMEWYSERDFVCTSCADVLGGAGKLNA